LDDRAFWIRTRTTATRLIFAECKRIRQPAQAQPGRRCPGHQGRTPRGLPATRTGCRI